MLHNYSNLGKEQFESIIKIPKLMFIMSVNILPTVNRGEEIVFGESFFFIVQLIVRTYFSPTLIITIPSIK